MAKLLTLGYAGKSIEQVAAIVDHYDALLIDVRLKAWARVEDFRSGNLRSKFGSKYMHAPDLGNLNYKGDLGPDTMLKNPDAMVCQIGIWLEGGKNIILMCGCFSHKQCHRTDVSKLIEVDCGEKPEHLYPKTEKTQHDRKPDHDAGKKNFKLPPGYSQESFL